MAPPTLNPIPVYEYSPDAKSGGDTPDRFLYSDLPNVEAGWENKGVAFNAFEKSYPGVIPVFRHDAVNPQRFQYSTEPTPDPGSGWLKGGTAFYAFKTPQRNTVPLYRYSATDPQREKYSTNSDLGSDLGNDTWAAAWTNVGAAFHVLS